MVYIMTYKGSIETMYIPTHVSSKTHNYYHKHENNMILMLNYSEQVDLDDKNMRKVHLHTYIYEIDTNITEKMGNERLLPLMGPRSLAWLEREV